MIQTEKLLRILFSHPPIPPSIMLFFMLFLLLLALFRDKINNIKEFF